MTDKPTTSNRWLRFFKSSYGQLAGDIIKIYLMQFDISLEDIIYLLIDCITSLIDLYVY